MPENFTPQPTQETSKKEAWLNKLGSPETRIALSRHIFYLRMGFSPEEKDDLIQTALLKATEAVKEGKFNESHGAKLTTWLYRITTNAAIDLLRKKKHLSTTDPLPETHELPNNEPTARESYIATDMIEKLRSHFNELPPEQQEVVKMREDGLSFKQIAKHQGVAINTAKSRMRYALAYLKKWIQDKDKDKE